MGEDLLPIEAQQQQRVQVAMKSSICSITHHICGSWEGRHGKGWLKSDHRGSCTRSRGAEILFGRQWDSTEPPFVIHPKSTFEPMLCGRHWASCWACEDKRVYDSLFQGVYILGTESGGGTLNKKTQLTFLSSIAIKEKILRPLRRTTRGPMASLKKYPLC